jgi:hypothetical protein
MNELNELETVFCANTHRNFFLDSEEPEPSDEELERRFENRRAYRKPYDWMTELE